MPNSAHMTSLTEQELLALEALCNAATPGPWDTGPKTGAGFVWVYGPRHTQDVVGEPLFKMRGNEAGFAESAAQREKDAAFIAAARTALPRVLQELRDARVRISELEEDNDAPLHEWLNQRGVKKNGIGADNCVDGVLVRLGYLLEKLGIERDDFARRCIWVARRMAEQAGGNILVENVLAAVKAGLAREQEKSKP